MWYRLAFEWPGGGILRPLDGQWPTGSMCRASLIQDGWNCLFVRSIPASEAERHLGWGSVNYPLFTTLLFFQWSNIWTASKLSIPKTCPEDQEASFPSENQSRFKAAFVSELGIQDFCEIHQYRWQTDRCPNLNRNQSSVTILKKKVALFSDLYHKQQLQSVIRTENMSTICFYSLGKKNSILLSSS